MNPFIKASNECLLTLVYHLCQCLLILLGLDTVAYVCFSLLCVGVYVFIQYGRFKGIFHLWTKLGGFVSLDDMPFKVFIHQSCILPLYIIYIPSEFVFLFL